MIEHPKSVSEADHRPIVVHYADRLAVARWTGPASVVLQSSAYPVERKPVVRVNFVVLPERNVVDRFPGFAAIIRDRDASVLANPDSTRVLRINPEAVIVHVNASGNRAECFTAVD